MKDERRNPWCNNGILDKAETSTKPWRKFWQKAKPEKVKTLSENQILDFGKGRTMLVNKNILRVAIKHRMWLA